MKKKKFSLKIKDNNNTNSFKNFYYDDSSVLTSYEEIISKINEVIQKKKSKKCFLEINLYHFPTNENIIIKNEFEWNFLYNYNVINECIDKNRLKINYTETAKSTENEGLYKIIKYIMEKKVPKSFYLYSLISFINYKNFLDEFIKFFCNQLYNTDLDKIREKENYNIKFDTKFQNKKEKKEEHNNINKNISFLKTKEFLELFNSNYLKTIKIIDSFKRIETIINVKNEENQFNDNICNKTTLNKEKKSDNDDNSSDDDILKTLNKSFEKTNYLLLDDDINESIYLDNKKYFKKFNKKNYYIGIEDYKDKINKNLLIKLNK